MRSRLVPIAMGSRLVPAGIALSAALALALGGCGVEGKTKVAAPVKRAGAEPKEQKEPKKRAPKPEIELVRMPNAPGPVDVAMLSVKDYGEIRIELRSDIAPETVENFVKLANEGFYDGTTFHRVIPDFMIQGGDPNSKNRDARDDGKGGPGYSIEDEFSEISHARGIVSMANLGGTKTAGSQFFIMIKDTPALDGKYAVFGRVISGIDVADRITLVERDRYGRHGPADRPMEDVVVESIRIERPGQPGGTVASREGAAG